MLLAACAQLETNRGTPEGVRGVGSMKHTRRNTRCEACPDRWNYFRIGFIRRAVRHSRIHLAAIMPIAMLRPIPAFLFGQASAGPRSSGKVAFE